MSNQVFTDDMWDDIFSPVDKYGEIDEKPTIVRDDPLATVVSVGYSAGRSWLTDKTIIGRLDAYEQLFTPNKRAVAGYTLGQMFAAPAATSIHDKAEEMVSIGLDHRTTADEIRNYFNSKLTMLKLQGFKLSKYQQAISDFITRTGIEREKGTAFSLKKREIGLVTNLHEAWADELMMDAAATQCIVQSLILPEEEKSLLFNNYIMRILNISMPQGKAHYAIYGVIETEGDFKNHFVMMTLCKSPVNRVLFDEIASGKIHIKFTCRGRRKTRNAHNVIHLNPQDIRLV